MSGDDGPDGDDSSPVPSPPDDDMDATRYEFPPGLMPDAEFAYDVISADEETIVYTKDRPKTEYIRSTHAVHLFE